MDSFDYVIVGAGTAGSVVANRLSADGKSSVLVLEAVFEELSMCRSRCLSMCRSSWARRARCRSLRHKHAARLEVAQSMARPTLSRVRHVHHKRVDNCRDL